MSPDDGTNGDATFVRITNQMIWLKLQEIESKLAAIDDYEEVKRQVKSLNFKFYGVVAGFVGALTLIATGALGKLVG